MGARGDTAMAVSSVQVWQVRKVPSGRAQAGGLKTELDGVVALSVCVFPGAGGGG
jgi:hypothetical protein